MHGTLSPLARRREAAATSGDRFDRRLLWAALVPMLLLLHPYEGLIQDARIYIGRGVADRDPLGIGRDLMFATDGQTDFTVLKPVIRLLLGVLQPADLSIVLAAVGGLLWLAAVAALGLKLARGRAGWAAAVCVVALPAGYGGYLTFTYGETLVTPRIFAEGAVLGAIAAFLDGRRIAALALLALGFLLHPLMALPGIGVATVILVAEDRRWLVPVVAALLAVAGAAWLGLPVAGQLFMPMDAAWLGILKTRSVNIFPSLWTGDVYAHAAARAAATGCAAILASGRPRLVLLAVLAVACCGLAAAAVFGDAMPLVLVTQLQPWRALWLLAVVGNASLALSAIGLWRRGPGAWLTLAVLLLAWLAVSTPALSIGLAGAAVALCIADDRGALAAVTRRIGVAALALACAAAVVDTVMSGVALAGYLTAARQQGGEALYALMLVPGLQHWPLAFGAVALALRADARSPASAAPRRFPRAAATVALVAVSIAAGFAWNSIGSERREMDVGAGRLAELRRLIGPEPGSILWVDDYNQAWFVAGRPAYFNSTQGCPILFSRRLALAWWARGEALVRAGLAREADLEPWTSFGSRDGDLPVTRAGVEAVCRAADHPVAIVAPGSHLDAAPPGWPAGLWRPPSPVQYLSGDGDGLRWHKVDAYTVIRCGPDGAGGDAAAAGP